MAPGGGAAVSGPCFEAWAIAARPAGTIEALSALPAIVLIAVTARNSACCSLLPASKALDASNNAECAALICVMAKARLPAPPPGDIIGDVPGPPGPPTGDLGIAGVGPPGPAPGGPPGGPGMGGGKPSGITGPRVCVPQLIRPLN